MGRKRKRLSPCERRVKGTGKIYKIKHVSKVRGKGKYVRNERNKLYASLRQKGKECGLWRFTDKDRERQGHMVKEMGRALSKTDKVKVGSIPDLKKAMNGVYLMKLKALEESGVKGVEEIARMEALAEVGVGVMTLLLDKWRETDELAKNATEIEQMKMYSKFLDRCFNKWGMVNEEMRKTISTIHEMKYGKKLTVESKGKYEDDLDKLQVINVESVSDDTGSKTEPN